ncbi:MAG: aldose 1-epimerase family protein [Lachnospiraceae bacterium]|nr:aldose 1-epimerase family protein [Lachnospiraceae bacterium]
MEYVIKNDSLTVTVSTAAGALTSIKDSEGVERLWQGDPGFWKGQDPTCFPICGSIRNNEAVLRNGKITKMPRHGLLKNADFTCTAHKDTTVTMSVTADDAMIEAFPFRFRFDITYTLKGNALEVAFTVTNLETEEVMPFMLGGHPGFCCPVLEGETYEDYYLEFSEEETCTVPRDDTETALFDVSVRTPFLDHQKILPLTHAYFDIDLVCLDELKSRSITLASRKSAKTLTLNFADFSYIMLWSTKKHADFLAIEPWIGMSTCSDEGDIFEEKRLCQFADPGESKRYAFEIVIGG